jgi:hypothetical protein
VILFEMLAGRAPFVAVEPGDYLAMHMLQPPPRLSDLVPNLPPPLVEMAWKMLAKEPSERPTMAQVTDLLRRLLWISGEAITIDGKVQEAGYFGESGRVFAESGRVAVESGHKQPDAVRAVSEPSALAPTVTAPSAVSGPVLAPELSKPGRLQALVAEAIAEPTALPTAPEATVPPTPADPAAAQRLAEAATMVRPASSPSKTPAQSSPIWEPMEIVKTDYHSSPGVPLRSLKTPTPKPTPATPPAPVVRPTEWLWWALLALAIVLAVLLARVLPR